MKLLSIVWYKVLPARFGGQKGTAIFNKYLANHFDLTCLCSSNNEQGEQLPYKVLPDLPVSKKQFLQPSTWKIISRVAAKEKSDVLILEYPYHAIAALRIKKKSGIPYILHQHNIEYQRFRQLGKPWWRLLKQYEKWACRNASLVLFKTIDDRLNAIKEFRLDANKCLLVPYGIEINKERAYADLRKKHGIAQDEKLVLFAGTLDYAPNADAVKNIFEQLLPVLDRSSLNYRLIICGRNKMPGFEWINQLHHPKAIMAGEVDEIESYFHHADCFIVPVLTGGGVQTKIIDAIAENANVVAFDFALRGIQQNVTGKKLFTVKDNDWIAFAGSIQAATQMKTATPASFFETYSWEHIIANIVPRIKQIQNERTAG